VSVNPGRASIYIREAAAMVGVSPTAIRGWEQHGFIRPARGSSGYRLFSNEDITRLRQIRRLMQDDGLNPAAVRRILGDAPAPPNAAEQSASDGPGMGHRLKALRQEKGLSLRDLAARSGVSASYLSSVERSLASPSVAALQKIAAAVGTNMVDMLTERTGDDPGLLVRPDQRRILELGSVPGVRIEQLAGAQTQLESLLFIVGPGAGSVESYSHIGEEFLYLISGAFEVTLDEAETYLMAPEDTLAFASLRPHRFRNPSTETAVVLWVNTPPTF
jgi:DNA-binding transcriptional MerR regulator/mannose-6-phosphate isomerase-like protein (cupin superfamily)